jgi:CHAT domain-containing protein
MSEIMELRLDADWIVLSACNTAGDDGSGGGPASGLARAFFYAGARSVLATNWAVHSRSAAALTVATFRNHAASRTSRAQALRNAQLEMIRAGHHRDAAGRALYAYAHPLFWAAWSLLGDGGRSGE